jgi:hypothetical protein
MIEFIILLLFDSLPGKGLSILSGMEAIIKTWKICPFSPEKLRCAEKL